MDVQNPASIDFATSEYLHYGTPVQRNAYKALACGQIMEKLKDYDPLITGTIPIGIDVKGSDLDIICCYENASAFRTEMEQLFGGSEGFTFQGTGEPVVFSFMCGGFEVEIYGQSIPTRQQNAWLHMLVEHAVLNREGEEFREEIIRLKSSGIKTEPAFAQLLGLEGDPYLALLEYGRRNSFI